MSGPVETYSGYRADERPTRFRYEGRKVEVKRILRQWREPEAECFRVQGDDARTYELCFLRTGNEWVASRLRW